MTEDEIKAMTAENKALKADNDKLNASAKATATAAETAKQALATALSDKAVLEQKNAHLLAENAQLITDLEQADTMILDLKDEISAQTPATDPLPQIDVDGKTYLLTSSFTWAGLEITIDVLQDNAKLVAELVEAQVGNLQLAG